MSSIPLFEADLEHVLELTEPVWSEARGQRFFVTGGTGFFGMWLLESFAHINRRLNLGASMTVLTRAPQAFAGRAAHVLGRGDVQLVEGDVRCFSLPRGEFRFVIHAAAEASVSIAPAEMLDTIVEGTRRVLELAAERGATRLLLVSSGAVYGTQPPNLEAMSEDLAGGPDPTDPRSAYAEGKRVAELLCAIASSQSRLQCTLARCFAFVGPHLPLDRHFAIGNFIARALADQTIEVAGDGTPVRSYLYAADLAAWLWKILFCGQAGRAYNVGSDEAVSIARVAQMVADAANEVAHPFPPSPRSPLEVVIARRAVSGGSGARYVPCIARAGSELGLAPQISLSQAILRTLAWYRLQSEESRSGTAG
jgi:dTDP-glucose 4,6-dehydratase